MFDQVKNRLQVGFDFIGEQEVKNIAELVRAYRVVVAGQNPAVVPASKRDRPKPVSRQLVRKPPLIRGLRFNG